MIYDEEVQLRWYLVEGVDQYRVQVAHDADFTLLLLNQTFSDTSIVFDDLDMDCSLYYWCVRGELTDGVYGVWSQSWIFTSAREIEPGEHITVLLPGDVPLVLVYIPAGTYMRGRYPGEQDARDNESPQHVVTLTQDFCMGKYVVTKRQWEAVMETTPWAGQPYVLDDPNSPAVYVSWDDAQSFITALNAHITSTDQGAATFRLPSEAVWRHTV